MKILLVEDETLMREALSMLLRHAGENDGPQAQVVEASSAGEGLAILARQGEKPPDLILLDFFLPDGMGGEVVSRFVAAAPSTPVVVVSPAEDGRDAAAALSCGAVGYLSKSASYACLRQIVALVRSGELRHPFALFNREGGMSVPRPPEAGGEATSAGAVPLTARQREVVRLVVSGRTNKEIARVLGVREATVKAHLRMILRQGGFRNRTQLAVHETGGGVPSGPGHPASVAGGRATLALPVPAVLAGASQAPEPDRLRGHAGSVGPEAAGAPGLPPDETDPYWMAPF